MEFFQFLIIIFLSPLVTGVIKKLKAYMQGRVGPGAFQARGAPDQKAINHFAATVSPKLTPWLEMLLTLAVAISVARRVEKARIMHGLVIGILAGILSVTVTLPLGGRLSLHKLLFFLIVVGLGWLGGFIGRKGGLNTKSSP